MGGGAPEVGLTAPDMGLSSQALHSLRHLPFLLPHLPISDTFSLSGLASDQSSNKLNLEAPVSKGEAHLEPQYSHQGLVSAGQIMEESQD